MGLPEEERDLRPVPAFDVALESGPWHVSAFEPERLLRLETAHRAERSEVLRRVKVFVVAVALGAALGVGWWAARGDFGAVVLPLIVLFGLVAVASLLSAKRQWRRAMRGVVLEADATRGAVRGIPEAQGGLRDFAVQAVEAPFAEVRAVVLSVNRRSGDQRPAKACVTLRVHLGDGRTLEGPDAWSPDEAWPDARDHLAPAAVELARLCRCPLEVRYPFAQDTFTLEHSALPPRAEPEASPQP